MGKQNHKFGLIGFPLSHSFSKSYFLSKFEKEGLLNFEYVNCEVADETSLKLLLSSKDFSGFNVTIPWKEKIIKYLDEIDDEAKIIGAVNTIKRTIDNKLIGYNTDVIGFSIVLKQLLKSYHRSALIIGTGGASKAVSFALKQLNIQYKFISRTPSNILELAYDDITIDHIRNTKLIINTSPIGMYPEINNFPDIPYDGLSKKHLLFDLIYNPIQTLFLKKGEQNGAETVNGYAMLIHQAEESWKIWNGI